MYFSVILVIICVYVWFQFSCKGIPGVGEGRRKFGLIIIKIDLKRL